MYQIGDRVVYGSHGVCTVTKIGALAMSGVRKDQVYYTLDPLNLEGTIYTPVDGKVNIRPVISRQEAEDLIRRIPAIPPRVCHETRPPLTDAFYEDSFRTQDCTVLVGLIKGLYDKRRNGPSYGSATLRTDGLMKRAKSLLYGELSVALRIPLEQVEPYIHEQLQQVRQIS